MGPAIAIFAKAPVPGRVKTRLATTIGSDRAAELYEEMVARLLERLLRGGLVAGIELHTDIQTDAWRAFDVTRRIQAGGDLGDRMHAALAALLGEGRTPAMILGGDAPTVPIAHLDELLRFETDVALGPAEDGGYYAIACRRVAAGMFGGVEWSTDRALSDTVRSCERAGLSVALGRFWFDVDEPGDLDRLREAPE